ncbi:MAG TPA: hypothetical protein VMU14_08875, partial [Acidimicrobiales bacterium]|nr:hypothetical protein [Acidimicrobiales bacterium]
MARCDGIWWFGARRRRRYGVAVLAGVSASVGLVCAIVVPSAVGAATTLPAPSLTVRPEVGAVRLSWPAVPSPTRVTYVVTSSPTGKGCQTAALSCRVPVTDSTPWRFQVTAV